MLLAKARRTKPYISGSWNQASERLVITAVVDSAIGNRHHVPRDARVDDHQTLVGHPLGSRGTYLFDGGGQSAAAAEGPRHRTQVRRWNSGQLRLSVMRSHLVVLRPQRLVIQHRHQ